MPSLRDKTPSRAWTMRLARSTAVGLVLGSGLGVLQLHADAQSLPDFFPAHLKDDYMELISADLLAEDTCAKRLAIYKELAQVGDQQMAQLRFSVLEDLGYCSLKDEDFRKAQDHFQSSLQEVESFTRVSDATLLKMPQLQQFAHLVFLRDAAAALKLKKWGEAAMMLRRVALVRDRGFDKELKVIAEQNALATKADIKKDWDRVKQRVVQQLAAQPGATGNVIKSQSARIELLDSVTARIDKASGVNSYRKKAVSDSKYVAGLLTADTVWETKDLQIVQDLKALKWPEKLEGKQISLVAPRQDEKACDEKVFPELCKLLSKAKYSADIFASVFGGAKVLGGSKKDTSQKLEMCESNAVVGLLLSDAADFTLTFEADSGRDVEKVTVEKKTPTFVNFCRPIRIERSSPVLFLQMWHPELASLERTTLIRSSFAANKDKANAMAKLVNKGSDYWEKTKKQWQAQADQHHKIDDIDSDKKKAKLASAEKKQEELDELDEEARKKAVEKLEQQRKEKLEAEREKNLEKKKKQEAMAAKKKAEEPWRNVAIMMKPRGDAEKEKDAKAQKVETTLQREMDALEELKAEKRDLDRQLEFGQASELVKDINALERRVKSAEKLAKKAWKKQEKAGAAPAATAAGDDDKDKEDKKPASKVEQNEKDSKKSESSEAPATKERETAAEPSKKSSSSSGPEGKKAKENKKAADTKKNENKKDGSAQPGSGILEKAKTDLEKAKEKKKKALEKEDYKKAKSLKLEIEKLEKKIEELELSGGKKDEL